MAVNAFLTFYDKDDGATDSFRFTDYKPTESLAVDPTNPNTEVDGRDFLAWQRQSDTSETGGVSVAGGDVDAAALGDPITFTYTVTNTSSAYEGTTVAMENLVIAHEGSSWLI